MLKPNTLVTYKGGGYDGCIWEWNYAFIDEGGKFHDIYSSGRMGCKNLEELKSAYAGRRAGDFSLRKATSSRSLQKFSDIEPVHHVLNVAKFFAENFPQFKLMPKCNCCGKRFDAADGEGDGYHGVGGIHIEASDIICGECHNKYTCTGCNEYYGPDHQFVETDHLSHACEYCAETEAQNVRPENPQAQIEEWRSLAARFETPACVS